MPRVTRDRPTQNRIPKERSDQPREVYSAPLSRQALTRRRRRVPGEPLRLEPFMSSTKNYFIADKGCFM